MVYPAELRAILSLFFLFCLFWLRINAPYFSIVAPAAHSHCAPPLSSHAAQMEALASGQCRPYDMASWSPGQQSNMLSPAAASPTPAARWGGLRGSCNRVSAVFFN